MVSPLVPPVQSFYANSKDPNEYMNSLVDENEITVTEPLVDNALEQFDTSSIFERTMSQLRAENGAYYAELCKTIPPHVLTSRFGGLFN